MGGGRDNEIQMIDIHYSDSNDTNNIRSFSFVSRTSVPIPRMTEAWHLPLQVPLLAFSSDGSKFAMGLSSGKVIVWDLRSKVPLKTFTSDYHSPHIYYLQFSSGKLGKEALVFIKVRLMFKF